MAQRRAVAVDGHVAGGGDVAGTTARLQPAQIHLHWAKVSIADLFRLMTGNDSGVRGEFALDGNASVGTGPSGPAAGSNPWEFALQARAEQIHRWDLTERNDNPRISVNVKGQWNVAAGEARAEELGVETAAIEFGRIGGVGNGRPRQLACGISERGRAGRGLAGVVSRVPAGRGGRDFAE